MGKKTKSGKVKSKIHVKVKKGHIATAHDKLRLKFNERFNCAVPVGNAPIDELSDTTTSNTLDAPPSGENDNQTETQGNIKEIQLKELLDKLTDIIEFYRTEKIPRTEMINGMLVDPVDLAYNTLCDEGIKRTINHGQQLQIPGEQLRKLFMRAYYGKENITEEEEEYQININKQHLDDVANINEETREDFKNNTDLGIFS